MSTPWLSVICPTIGRDTLERFLRSVRLQAPATEVELVVVGDTYQGDFVEALAPVPPLCTQYDARYVAYGAEAHCVGHPQREYGATQATGDWLWWLQDDDILLPGAVELIRQTVVLRQSPHLFRVHTQWGFPVWQNTFFLEGNLDADCIVVPNDPARLGCWERKYEGDFPFIRQTCERWDWTHRWVDAFIARARPTGVEDWTTAV